jgi:DNA-binding NarL/FixJ family response regulator
MERARMLQVVLAEDQAVVRDGLRRILESGGCAIAGETGDGLQVVALVKQTRCDLLLLDLGLPGLHGLDVLREVRRHVPHTRVLVLSGEEREDIVIAALRHGAAGYLLKTCSGHELLQAVQTVIDGRRFVSPGLSDALARALEPSPAATPDPYETLTRREREVLHLIAEGLSMRDVGTRLGISPRTAEDHRNHIVGKLGLRTTRDVTLYALRRGLLKLDP